MRCGAEYSAKGACVPAQSSQYGSGTAMEDQQELSQNGDRQEMPTNPRLRRPEPVSLWFSHPLEALDCRKMRFARLSFDYHLRDEKCNPFRVCKCGSELWIFLFDLSIKWERPLGAS